MRQYLTSGALLLLAACARTPPPVDIDITGRKITLPDGAVIAAEVRITPQQQAYGMMFRSELPHNRGMLFVNTEPQTGAYWMKNCNFPLDIIFMDSTRKVVEIAANSPPCREDPCPNFGGHARYQYVLELNGGDAAKHGIKEGATLEF
jgi:uncharacterized membrane protein (UPF0127 family)